MKKIYLCLLAALTALALCASASAAVVEPDEDFYYLDTANVLSRETEGTIYFCNQQLYEQCGGQIVVAALESIDGADIYDYAYELFNEWGIGSAEENNGFLLLMAIEEDDYYMLAGSGIDGVFSSSVLNEMMDEYLEPSFAAKNYDAAALDFFGAVLERYADYYNLDLDLADGKAAYEQYQASDESASDLGGAGASNREINLNHEIEMELDEAMEDFDLIWSVLKTVAGFVLLIVVLNLLFGGRSRRRSGPSVLPFFILGRRRPPRPPRPHPHEPRPPRHDNHRDRGPRPPFGGGFGGGHGGFGGGHGGGGFGGGRSGGFGGGHGGGGGSFGGGAGRGRH